jgi:hypothetical protein
MTCFPFLSNEESPTMTFKTSWEDFERGHIKHDSWTWVPTEGHNSLVDQVLIGSCHMQTYENKKEYSHINLRSHTRNETRSPVKNKFLDSSYDQSGDSFTDVEVHSGLCCLTPDLLVVVHVLLSPLSSFTRHFAKTPKNRFSIFLLFIINR